MNLKELTQLREQGGQLESRRHDKAEELLYQGLAALQYAHETGYERPEILKQACAWLIEAMKANRSDSRPPIALAFLFMIIEDYDTATEYLQLVLGAEPQNVFALALREALQEQLLSRKLQPGAAPLAAPAGQAAPSAELDFDQLYEQTRREILAAARHLMSSPKPVAGGTPAHLKALHERVSEGRRNLQGFLAQLERLEADIDTSELSRLLKPFEAHCRECERLLALSERWAMLSGRTDELTQNVLQALRNGVPPQDSAQAEQELETWLDACDALADELDELEKTGLELAELLNRYEKLIVLMENYRETLDDGSQ